MPRLRSAFLLALSLWPIAVATPAGGQTGLQHDPAGVEELRDEIDVLQIAYRALLDVPGKGPGGKLNGAQYGRAQAVSRALRKRTQIVRRPGRAAADALAQLESARHDLLRPLWIAGHSLAQRQRHADAGRVRELAERWTESLGDSPPAEGPAGETEPDRPLPDLDELTTRVWILRLARDAHAARGAERDVRVLDSALRYAELRLEGAPWSEEAVALSRVAPPEQLARVVERAAAHLDAAGEASRARICRRLVRFYRGEPQVEEPPLEDPRAPRTEVQERHLRIVLAAREAHLLAGEREGADLLDRLARTIAAGEKTDQTPAQITALLRRAAKLHRAQGFEEQAESADGLVEELYGMVAAPSLEALQVRIERLERELRELRRQRR